jgi:hypothetical protein
MGYGMQRTYIINNILSSLYAYNSETNLGEKQTFRSLITTGWAGIRRSPRLVWK